MAVDSTCQNNDLHAYPCGMPTHVWVYDNVLQLCACLKVTAAHCGQTWLPQGSKLPEKLINGATTLVGQVIPDLLIKTLFACFDQNLKTCLAYWNLLRFLLQEITLFFKKLLTILRLCTKHAQFQFRVQFLLKGLIHIGFSLKQNTCFLDCRHYI